MQPDKSIPSPNGRFRLDFFAYEVRMSHWLECPFLFDTEVEKYTLNTGTNWDCLYAVWSGDGNTLTLELRHYCWPAHAVDVILDLDKDVAEVRGPGSKSIGTLAQMCDELREADDFWTLF